MTPDNVNRCFELVTELPLSKQAVCVRIAVEGALPVWRAWCKKRNVEDLSASLLDCFDQWCQGTATDDELNELMERVGNLLPEDICQEADPGGVYAGYALLDIASIALDKCGEVHDSILHTAIYFAASACCGIGTEAVWVDLERLTEPELVFLDNWFNHCRRQFPELANYE